MTDKEYEIACNYWTNKIESIERHILAKRNYSFSSQETNIKNIYSRFSQEFLLNNILERIIETKELEYSPLKGNPNFYSFKIKLDAEYNISIEIGSKILISIKRYDFISQELNSIFFMKYKRQYYSVIIEIILNLYKNFTNYKKDFFDTNFSRQRKDKTREINLQNIELFVNEFFKNTEYKWNLDSKNDYCFIRIKTKQRKMIEIILDLTSDKNEIIQLERIINLAFNYIERTKYSVLIKQYTQSKGNIKIQYKKENFEKEFWQQKIDEIRKDCKFQSYSNAIETSTDNVFAKIIKSLKLNLIPDSKIKIEKEFNSISVILDYTYYVVFCITYSSGIEFIDWSFNSTVTGNIITLSFHSERYFVTVQYFLLLNKNFSCYEFKLSQIILAEEKHNKKKNLEIQSIYAYVNFFFKDKEYKWNLIEKKNQCVLEVRMKNNIKIEILLNIESDINGLNQIAMIIRETEKFLEDTGYIVLIKNYKPSIKWISSECIK